MKNSTRFFLKLIFLFLLTFTFSLYGFSQTINATTYAFSSSTGNTLEDMTTGLSRLSGNSDDVSAGSGGPTGGMMMFVAGERGLITSCSSNGLMRVNGSSMSAAPVNDLASGTDFPRLAPYWDDLRIGLNGSIRTKTVGTWPNRKFVMDYNNMQVPKGTAGQPGSANFQVWIWEISGVIEFVYGTGMVENPGGYTIGIGASTTQFASVTTSDASVSYSVSNNTQTGAIAAGTKYTFTPQNFSAPTNISFANITSGGMRINWADNSTSESRFVVYNSTDNVNFSYAGDVLQNVTTLLLSNLQPSQTYYWKVYSVSQGGYSLSALEGSQSTNAPVVKTSVPGAVIWGADASWSPSGVPVNGDDVIIADGSIVTINTSVACHSVTIGQGSGGTLQYGTNASTFTVYGSITVNQNGLFSAGTGSITGPYLAMNTITPSSFINNGTVDFITTSGITINFTGAADITLSGSGTTEIYGISIDKGDTSGTVEVTNLITLGIPVTGTRLNLTSGTFKLSSASVLTPFFGGTTIGTASTKLWLNHAGASLSSINPGVGTGAVFFLGHIQIDAGTFSYGSGSELHQFVPGSVLNGATASLTITGGAMNLYGGFQFPSSDLFTLNISGGSLNMNPQGANNLGASIPSIAINAQMNFNWSGGNICFVNPHSASGTGGELNLSSLGIKNITGGSLVFGDGVSVKPGPSGNAGGFYLNSPLPLHNVVINNRTNADSTRMVRIVSNALYINDLTVEPNSYLFLGSGATRAFLRVKGNIINNGTIAGCEPGGTQSIGILYFDGTGGTQTLSGSGIFKNNSELTIDNRGSGVEFSNSSAYKVRTVNLITGTLNPGSNFTIGNAYSSAASDNPAINLGGNPLLTSGKFTSVPAFDETDGRLVLNYANQSGNYTVGSYNEIGTGIVKVAALTFNDTNGFVIPSSITLNIRTLTMTRGNIDLSGGNITVGFGVDTLGTISNVNGYIQNGSLTRWYTTNGTPTSPNTALIGYFPLGYNNYNRNFFVYFTTTGALSTGGTITVSHTNNKGIETIPGFIENGITVDTRSKSFWTVSTSGIVLSGSNRMGLRAQGSGAVKANDVASIRLMQSNSAAGTHVNGTNTGDDPQASRTSLTVANLNNNFYIGGNNSNILPFYNSWIGGDGSWSTAANWSAGYAPLSTDDVLISPVSPSIITLDGSYTVGNLTMGNNPTVMFISNTLTVNNVVDLQNGTMDIDQGLLDVKGNLAVDTGVITGLEGTIKFSGTTPQSIDFGETGTVIKNIIFTGGGAGNPKIINPANSAAVSILNDYTVESTAQLSLSTNTIANHNIQGNLYYSGITGGANMEFLFLNLQGSDKVIGSSVLMRGVSNINNNKIRNTAPQTETKYEFIQGNESDNVRSMLNINSDKKNKKRETTEEDRRLNEAYKNKISNTKLKQEELKPVKSYTSVYTKESMKDVVERIFAAQKPGEKIVIVLEDATLIKNSPNNTDGAAMGSFGCNVTLEANSSYTLQEDIVIEAGKTLSVLGRLDCGTNTVGGAGNSIVTGAFQDNNNGIIGTANTASQGFTNFILSGVETFASGDEFTCIIDYNASADQTINLINHPANTFIMCSGSGTKILGDDLTFSTGSNTGSAGATPELTKGALTVRAGVAFADNGKEIYLPDLNSPYANIIIEGNYLSTGSGKITWPGGSTFSTVYAKEGTAFGELELNSFQFSPNLIMPLSSDSLNLSVREMSFTGNTAGFWRISSRSNTTLTVTGNINLNLDEESFHAGGFVGSTGNRATVKVLGNVVSTSLSNIQPIMSGSGTNIFEMNGSTAQTISFATALTELQFFTNTTLKINNSNGVTLTNNGASACIFQFDVNSGLYIQSGNLLLGEADVLGYSSVNSYASFGNATINNSTWPVTNAPVNVNIEGSCTMPGPRTVEGILTMNNGILNTNGFALTIGTSASDPGEIVRTGGSIRGTLKRWIPASTTVETLFPMDNNNGQYVPAKVSFTDAPDAGGSLTASFISSGSGTNGLPIPDGPGGFEITNSAPGYWVLNAADGLSGYTYDIECLGADFPGIANVSTLSMLKRNDSGSPWTWSSANHVTSGGTITEPIIRGKDFSSFSEFTMGSEMDNPLPVELSAFTSSINTRDVKLNWVTTHENNNAGFDIERSIKNQGKSEWKKIGHMQGAGTTSNPTAYNFEDRKLETGKYAYRLKQIDYNGTFKYYELTNEVIVGVPDKYSLSQNYPNPFNPSTKIDYNLPYDSKVEIKMYDMTGKEVASIVNTAQLAGYYTVNFNVANLSSGTYFYRITAEGQGNNKFAMTKKMMLVK